jgi:hypothetical protein
MSSRMIPKPTRNNERSAMSQNASDWLKLKLKGRSTKMIPKMPITKLTTAGVAGCHGDDVCNASGMMPPRGCAYLLPLFTLRVNQKRPAAAARTHSRGAVCHGPLQTGSSVPRSLFHHRGTGRFRMPAVVPLTITTAQARIALASFPSPTWGRRYRPPRRLARNNRAATIPRGFIFSPGV